MKPSDLAPYVYKNNLEYNQIMSIEDDEFATMEVKFAQSFADNFAQTATERGIKQYEDMLGIIADPTTEDLETRRKRVIDRLTSHIPFTMEYLDEQLDRILGEDNYTVTSDFEENMTLTISSLRPGKVWLTELYELLDKIIPCNIVWSVTVYAATWNQVEDSFPTWQDVYDSEMTWQEVMDGEWLD